MRMHACLGWSAVLVVLWGPLWAADFDFDVDQLNELSPRPGSIVNADTLARYSAFIDRDFARFIASGATTLTIGEPLSIQPPRAYLSATARFRGQPRLGEQPGRLEAYTQGRPFSGPLRSDDPAAGNKAAWNMRYAYSGDSGKLAEIRWQMRDWKSGKVQTEMLFEGRSIRFLYRHVQQPVPTIAQNPQDAFAAFYLRAVEAGSYNGSEVLVLTNRDEARPLNGWVDIPQLGRTQTLASFASEESMFGSDIAHSDFLLYAAPLTAMRWHYLGSSYMLLPFYRHDQIEPAPRKARHYEYWHVDFEGHAGCFPKVQWQLRPTLVLEGTATDPAAAVTHRVFYLDAQTFMPALWKIYQGDKQLWKFVINAYADPTSHLAENHRVEAPILTASATIDIAANRCTTVQVLTLVNPPDVTAADFASSTMQHGGGTGFRRR